MEQNFFTIKKPSRLYIYTFLSAVELWRLCRVNKQFNQEIKIFIFGDKGGNINDLYQGVVDAFSNFEGYNNQEKYKAILEFLVTGHDEEGTWAIQLTESKLQEEITKLALTHGTERSLKKLKKFGVNLEKFQQQIIENSKKRKIYENENNQHLNENKENKKQKKSSISEIPAKYRRLDSIARLLEYDMTCSAVCLTEDGTLLVTSNDLYARSINGPNTVGTKHIIDFAKHLQDLINDNKMGKLDENKQKNFDKAVQLLFNNFNAKWNGLIKKSRVIAKIDEKIVKSMIEHLLKNSTQDWANQKDFSFFDQFFEGIRFKSPTEKMTRIGEVIVIFSYLWRDVRAYKKIKESLLSQDEKKLVINQIKILAVGAEKEHAEPRLLGYLLNQPGLFEIEAGFALSHFERENFKELITLIEEDKTEFFKDKNELLDKIQRLKKPEHDYKLALFNKEEIELLSNFLKKNKQKDLVNKLLNTEKEAPIEKLKLEKPLYFGISKPCCPACHGTIKTFNQFVKANEKIREVIENEEESEEESVPLNEKELENKIMYDVSIEKRGQHEVIAENWALPSYCLPQTKFNKVQFGKGSEKNAIYIQLLKKPNTTKTWMIKVTIPFAKKFPSKSTSKIKLYEPENIQLDFTGKWMGINIGEDSAKSVQNLINKKPGEIIDEISTYLKDYYRLSTHHCCEKIININEKKENEWQKLKDDKCYEVNSKYLEKNNFYQGLQENFELLNKKIEKIKENKEKTIIEHEDSDSSPKHSQETGTNKGLKEETIKTAKYDTPPQINENEEEEEEENKKNRNSLNFGADNEN